MKGSPLDGGVKMKAYSKMRLVDKAKVKQKRVKGAAPSIGQLRFCARGGVCQKKSAAEVIVMR
jgi:hypothetical protein